MSIRLLSVGIFLLYTSVCTAQDYGFKVQNAEIIESENGFDLKASIDFRFSQRATEALANGVPLTVIVEAKVDRYRRFVWNKTVVRKKYVYRLTYHALPKRYRVYDQSQGGFRNYVDMRAAVKALGRIREAGILRKADIEPDNVYTAELKTYLDIEALPLPLRSIAYVIPQWYISSSWYKWPLEKLNHP